MERPTSGRLTDISRHSIDILRFVLRLTAASPDMTSLFKASGRGSHTPAHTIRDALTLIFTQTGPQCCRARPGRLFSVYVGHCRVAECRWGYSKNIPPNILLFNHGNLDLSPTVYFAAWMLRISLSIHYHPLFVYSSRTEQNRGSAAEKKKPGMNGRCGCLTFKSPRHLFY